MHTLPKNTVILLPGLDLLKINSDGELFTAPAPEEFIQSRTRHPLAAKTIEIAVGHVGLTNQMTSP